MATVNTIKGNPDSSMITKHNEFILAEGIPCRCFFRTQFIKYFAIFLQGNLQRQELLFLSFSLRTLLAYNLSLYANLHYRFHDCRTGPFPLKITPFFGVINPALFWLVELRKRHGSGFPYLYHPSCRPINCFFQIEFQENITPYFVAG